jgi:hypothetical protein
MKFPSSFFIVLTSFVLASYATNPGDVKRCVAVIAGKVTALDKAITQLPMNGTTTEPFFVCQLLDFTLHF